MRVKFKKFGVYVCVPEKATEGSAAYDIFSARSVTLNSGDSKTIETDIILSYSKKYVCRLYPCSGLSIKSTTLGGGVIDSDFRGTISVILTKHSKQTINIEIGDRIAQMIFLKKEDVDFVEVEELDEAE